MSIAVMPANPNQAPQTTPELSDDERQLLDIQKISEWRTHQYSILNGLRAASNFSNQFYVDDFISSVDSMLDDFLQQNGINQSSANYSEIRQLFYEARIGRGNGDGISEDEWGNSPASRGLDANDHKSQQDVFHDRISNRLGVDRAATSDDSDTMTEDEREARDAEFAQIETELKDARELLAVHNAKRQGRLFGMKKHEKLDELQKDYNDKLQALGRRHLVEHTDYDEEEKNLIATSIVFDEQEKLRELTTEKLDEKKISGMIKWMNKGKWYTRIGKGVAIGAGAGLAGSFLAGAVGAGIIAGGAVAATRFARGFAMKDHDKRGMASFEDTIDADAIDASMQISDDNDRMKKMDSFLGASDSFEKDTRHEQKKRRKAAAYGIGSMAVGALAGYGVHHLIAKDVSVIDHTAERMKNFFEGNGFHVDHQPTGLISTTGPSAGADVSSHSVVDSQQIDHGQTLHDKSLDWSDFSHDARYVHPGEGFYETFQDLGIPADHWADVLKDAGPKLHEQGLAYFDNAHGEWRISHPGNLPEKALHTIANSSKHDGFTLAA